MLGWTLVFALLSLSGVVTGFAGMATSVVFGFLLLASLLTRALRGPV